MMEQYTMRFRRQRTLLLSAPFILVPLFTILFAAFRGSRAVAAKATGIAGANGINLTLPPAHLPVSAPMDKSSFYKQAAVDSIREEERRRLSARMDKGVNYASSSARDTNTEKIQQKVAVLNDVLSRPSHNPVYLPPPVPPVPRLPDPGSSNMERLERMLRVMKETDTAADPDMQELNRALDKLIIAQQPHRAIDTARRGMNILPAVAAPRSDTMPGMDNDEDLEPGLELEMTQALVPETQSLVNGAVIRLELITDLVIKGDLIAAGTPVYGTCRLNNERLLVSVSSIQSQHKVYPVNLQVLDQDGMMGIYEPGSITREVMNESATQGAGSFNMGSFDPSIGGLAANAGLQMAKSIMSKKVRQVRVSVKAGYQVFLQDISQKHL